MGGENPPFFMYSEDLFAVNLENFLRNNPRLQQSDYSIESATRLRDYSNGEEEIAQWYEKSDKVLQLPRWIPRNQETAREYQESHSGFNLGSDIVQYLDLPDKDPHLVSVLLEIRNKLIELDIDPDFAVSQVSKPVHCLVVLATGDGRAIEWLLHHLDPFHLVVAVPDWNHYLSSFWRLNWASIWSKYSTEERSISIMRSNSGDEIRNAIAIHSLLSLEHLHVFTARVPEDNQISKIQERLNERHNASLVHYLGFTLDEYNMMINTIGTLKCHPRIYAKPINPIGGQVIVCGSGPSLDSAINTINALSATHIIIAGGSNYATLKAAGIDPDFLVLVERANDTYDDYLKVDKLYGRGNTRLVMSTTCPHGLTTLYRDTAIYFRPALTPLSVFSDNPNQVLYYEGPESINAAVAFASSLMPAEIVFFGADLGIVDKGKVRSENAVGVSPRTFNEEYTGNLVPKVFTSLPLLDALQNVEACIAAHASYTQFYNCSNGVLIEGATSILPSLYLDRSQVSHHKLRRYTQGKVDTWWESLSIYTEDHLKAMWQASEPRRTTFDLSRRLELLFSSGDTWIPSTIDKVEPILSLSCSPREQFPRRIMRSTVYKSMLAITQQMYILHSYYPAYVQVFEQFGKSLMTDCVRHIESEIYSMCDLMETL